MVPLVARWKCGGEAGRRVCTTLKGTMPAITRCEGGKCVVSTSRLPTPFCRLTTTAAGVACAAIRPAISAVAGVLTDTRMSSASAKACAGSLVRRMAPGATTPAAPLKSETRNPCRLMSAARSGRSSSPTSRPPTARQPPTKQPMLPAPATAIRLCPLMAIVVYSIASNGLHCTPTARSPDCPRRGARGADTDICTIMHLC